MWRADVHPLRSGAGVRGHCPESVATAVKGWITGVGAGTPHIEMGSPWENGYVESFSGEPLGAEVFDALAEARVLIERRRVHRNTARPHSSCGYRPPAPEVVIVPMPLPATHPGPLGSSRSPLAMLH